jgi:coiled-coil and C2 domain-containing protein 2A
VCVYPPQPRNCEVLVNIQKAFNLPVRAGLSDGGLHEGGHPAEATLLSAVVEVAFQGQQPATTSAVDGPNPLWNEQLVLDYRPPNGDFSPQSLMSTPDTLVISVYDEALVAEEEGGSPRVGYLRHYLGQLRIPIGSVYRSQTVDGTFELQVPPVLLGYTASCAAPPLLSVYIVLNPNILLPKVINEEV